MTRACTYKMYGLGLEPATQNKKGTAQPLGQAQLSVYYGEHTLFI